MDREVEELYVRHTDLAWDGSTVGGGDARSHPASRGRHPALDSDAADLFDRWQASQRRSSTRRGRERRKVTPQGMILAIGVGALLGAVIVWVARFPGGVVTGARDLVGADPAAALYPGFRASDRREATVPAPGSLRQAERYAQRRGGLVSFAVVDTTGRERGREEDRRFVSASLVKAVLLAAELKRLRAASAPLDEATANLLRSMITYSDNAAADAIYSRVGDSGLYGVAQRARMNRFTVSGYWANAEITAADMARFFAALRKRMRGPNREFALGLFGSVIAEQRWGIPEAAAAKAWAVRFKGGWRSTDLGSLVHQAAELRDGNRQLAISVLTDAQPSQEYAIETVRGVAQRLLRPAAASAFAHAVGRPST